MKVKILLLQSQDDYDRDGYSFKKEVVDSLTDWDEISNEDYQTIRWDLDKLLTKEERRLGLKPIIVIKDEIQITKRITDLKAEIEMIRIRDEQEKLKRQQQQKIRKDKKQKAELETFLKLKEKFEKG